MDGHTFPTRVSMTLMTVVATFVLLEVAWIAGSDFAVASFLVAGGVLTAIFVRALLPYLESPDAGPESTHE